MAAKMIKDARKSAGITQAELARRAGTAQSAVAAYESGRRTPSIATLKRLLEACDHELELRAIPRTRRGAASLKQIAQEISEDYGPDRDKNALRLLYGFADDFRGSRRPGKVALLDEEPSLTGEARFDAALAGAAEHFAREAGLPSPGWVEAASRFVEPWWFTSSREAFDAYTLAHTPVSFARHGVFIAREVFDRA